MTPSCLAILALGLQEPSEVEIRGKAGRSELVIRASRRFAGAIESLRWNGKEFIDRADHGRELQSAANFDAGGAFVPELFNPTEAGSMSDGAGTTSTSRLLLMRAEGAVLETRAQMAFWLLPGEKSAGRAARNVTALSDHVLAKKVTIGAAGLPHAIEYRVTFTVPKGERHTFAQFEAVTGYMPAEFSKFLAFDASEGVAKPLSDGPGEQERPVILSTPSGSHAMGVWSPGPSPGYGRFRFAQERVVKWNCVYRVKKPEGVAAGEYAYRCYVLVGTLEDVVSTVRKLPQALEGTGNPSK